MTSAPPGAELVESIEIPASQQVVWDAVVDWPGQRNWMLLTDVRASTEQNEGVGTQLAAFTGIGKLGFLDTMTVTEWEAPRRCVVVHTGRVVRGSAAFEVESVSETSSRFIWTEWIDLPFGAVGRLGWPLAKPFVAWGVRYSLRRLRRVVLSRG